MITHEISSIEIEEACQHAVMLIRVASSTMYKQSITPQKQRYFQPIMWLCFWNLPAPQSKYNKAGLAKYATALVSKD